MTLLLREPFNDLTAWTNLGGASIIAAGRTGTGGRVSGTSSRADFRLPPDNESEYVTVGFALKPEQLGSNWMLSFGSDAGATSHIHVLTTSAGGLWARRGPNGPPDYGTTVGGLLSTTTWAYVEVQVRLHTTAGFVIIRVDGIERLNVTGLNTNAGGTKTVLDTVRLGWPQFAGHLYDDLYIASGAGETFHGDMTVVAVPEARAARVLTRAAIAEPHTEDWYRNARSVVRVAFQGATTTALLGGAEARVLFRPTGGNLRLGGLETRVLARPTGGNLRLGGLSSRVLSRPLTGGRALTSAVRLQVLTPFVAPEARFWDGTAWVSGPVAVWDGVGFSPTLAVKVWDGVAWVDAV